MQLKSASCLSAFALICFVTSASLLGGCTTNPSKHPSTTHRKTSVNDQTVHQEINNELSLLAERTAPLRGPINDARLAMLEKAQDEAVIAASETKLPIVIPSVLSGLLASRGLASIRAREIPEPTPIKLKTLRSLENSQLQVSTSSNETPFIFDIPVTYNARVSSWIRFFQSEGRSSFKTWLERSARYVPVIEDELTRAGLPQDLVYVAMIESGFRPDAVSHMGAMGMWQFISATGRRYGLHIDWWLDERRDFSKSTHAAIAYMKDLNEQFNSWYLVTASYNMGETGVRRLMKRYGTNNFWVLADAHALPQETTDYVPKIIAATLIAKAPALYGFRDLEYQNPLSFDTVRVPGGTDIINLAGYLGVSGKYMRDLNPELTRGFIPREVRGHQIRVPKGSTLMVSQYARLQQSQSSSVTQEAAN